MELSEATNDVKREKSQIAFTYSSLDENVKLPTVMFEHNGMQPCTLDQLVAWLGYDNVSNGTFRNRLSSARLFKLIEITSNTVKLTELGRRIAQKDQERQARVEAFLNIPLYKEIYNRHKGHTLPNDSALESEMLGLGVPEKQKERARQVFQRSAKQAGFFEIYKDRLVLPSGATIGGSNDEPRETRNSASFSNQSVEQPTPQDTTVAKSNSFNATNATINASDWQLPIREPLIQGLFQALPPVRTKWSKQKRQEWVELALTAFKFLYIDEEERQM